MAESHTNQIRFFRRGDRLLAPTIFLFTRSSFLCPFSSVLFPPNKRLCDRRIWYYLYGSIFLGMRGIYLRVRLARLPVKSSPE